MDKRLARDRRWFEYHCHEGEDSGDAKLWHHTHQQVKVVKRLPSDEVDEYEVGKMYLVRFADGFEWSVFDDELVKNPNEFYRPDYKPKRRIKTIMLNSRDVETISKTGVAQYQTQVTITFVLNIKREMTYGELFAELDEESPMKVANPDLFEVSAERWDIHLKDRIPAEENAKI